MRQVKLSEVNKQVSVKDGKLFFGTKEVLHCSFIKEDTIAALYVVRVKDGDYNRFVTGFDLVGNRFWLGGVNLKMWKDQKQLSLPPAEFQNFEFIERVLDTLCDDTAGKEWMICEEEDFESQMNELRDSD